MTVVMSWFVYCGNRAMYSHYYDHYTFVNDVVN